MDTIRKFFRTLWGVARETAWVVGLLAYLGPGGKLVVMVAGLGTGLIAALQGTPWAVVITLGLVSAAATVVVVVAARAPRLKAGPDSPSLKPTKATEPPEPKPNQVQLEQVLGQKFANATVLLDGHHYINCEFKECTFQYNGGHFRADNCHFSSGKRGIISTDWKIVQTLKLMHGMGLTKEGAEHGEFIVKLPPR